MHPQSSQYQLVLSEITYIIEWIAAIIALLYYYKYRYTPIKTVLWILWITVAIEFCARITEWRIEGTNHFFYNCYILTVFPLLYYTIYRHIKQASRKKAIRIISLLTLVILIIRAFTTPFLTQFMVYMYCLGMLALIINLLFYAIDLLKNNAQIVLKNKLELFIFTGFTLFGISYMPLSFFMTGADLFDLSLKGYTILQNLQLSIVIVMNMLFIFGFIWTLKQPRNI